MKQQSLGLGQSNKRTRRREFLGEMERVVPWTELVALVAPYMPEGRRGRPPFAVEPMLLTCVSPEQSAGASAHAER